MNGEEFLQQQLDSYRAQTHSDWELLASDDGSQDASVSLLERFAERSPQSVTIVKGPGGGFWRNFMSLVNGCDSAADVFAYSDQDDIWNPEKLSRAIAWLSTIPADVPALYFTRTELMSRGGTSEGMSPLFERPPSFRNALVQNIGGGNTMAFNRAGLQAIRSMPPDASIVSHDWWTYQIVTGVGGVAYYDPRPSLRYRQHGGNVVGSNVGLKARLVRVRAFAGGRVVAWNDVNLAVLGRVRHLLTTENQATLDDFTAARGAAMHRRLLLLRRSGVYRQSLVENVGLFGGALLRRV